MTKRGRSILIAAIILMGTVVSVVVINQLSADDRAVNISIQTDKQRYSAGEHVNFTLTLKNSQSFEIGEVPESRGILLCRIPDGVDPYAIVSNRSYLYDLTHLDIPRGHVGFKDYSDADKTFRLTWNGTVDDYNTLYPQDYYRAPAGYYVIYAREMYSDTNGNTLVFRPDAGSIFYYEGLDPQVSISYNATDGFVNARFEVGVAGSLPEQMPVSLYWGVSAPEYASQLIYSQTENVTATWPLVRQVAIPYSMETGTYLRGHIAIVTPYGIYTAYEVSVV